MRTSPIQFVLSAAVLSTAAGLAACSVGNAAGPSMDAPVSAPGGATGSAPSTFGLPCDVEAVLQKNCRTCHGAEPLFGAPMSLTSHADLLAPAKSDPTKKVYELMRLRTHDVARPMPPPGNPKPTTEELQSLDAWIDGGAQVSTAACATNPPSVSAAAQPLTCAPGTTMQRVRPTKKFAMGQKPDEYICYSVDASTLRGDGATDKKHAVQFGAHIDNSKIVHHVILFQTDGADGATNGEPVPCAGGVGGSSRFVAGWAPGGTNFETPAEAGFPQSGSSKYKVQIHLNNQAGLVGEEDGSGFDMCVGAPRQFDADVIATGALNIQLPPRSSTEISCQHTWDKDTVHIFGASPHMHRLGRKMTIFRDNAAGPTQILDAPNFNFAVGGGASTVNLEVARGEKLRTMCGWSNSGDSTVRFGENTGDEMCFGFLMYYPRQDFRQFAVPAALSTCSQTTGAL